MEPVGHKVKTYSEGINFTFFQNMLEKKQRKKLDIKQMN